MPCQVLDGVSCSLSAKHLVLGETRLLDLESVQSNLYNIFGEEMSLISS